MAVPDLGLTGTYRAPELRGCAFVPRVRASVPHCHLHHVASPRTIHTPRTNLPSLTTLNPLPCRSQVLCKYHISGACRFGSDCAFSHNLSDLPSQVRGAAGSWPAGGY